MSEQRLIDANALKAKAFGKRGGLIHTADIDAMPTIEERKTGKWIIEPYDVENDIWVHRCGECMKVAMLGIKKSRFNYCPNCGARMVREGEDNDRA